MNADFIKQLNGIYGNPNDVKPKPAPQNENPNGINSNVKKDEPKDNKKTPQKDNKKDAQKDSKKDAQKDNKKCKNMQKDG